jgi:Peptidase family M28
VRQVKWIAGAVTGMAMLASASANAQEAELPPEIAATTQQLIADALSDEVGLQFVEDLTTEVGARLAGSPDEARARAWAMIALKDLNFDVARIEEFTIPYWARTHESARVVGANSQDLVITALGGSRATPEGGLEAEIVRFASLPDLQSTDAASLRGKIAFIDEQMFKTQDGSGYGLAVRKRGGCATAAAEKGAVACLIRSVGTQPHRMPHTGGMFREGALGALPAAALSGPDADQLTRLLARGPVRVNLEIGVEYAEEAPSGNVIAEVEGSDLKDEIVLIGCHLDSWDLGTGALDDGAGCGIVVGAAKLIADLPGKPRRTIRVVLYGSEEVGLFGANAYARQHGDELDQHVLAAESDFGAGRIWRFQTNFGDAAIPYADAMKSALTPLGVSEGDNAAGGGPDVGVLRRAGVPVVTPGQDGSDYFDYHHTPDDTFDKIDGEDFRQNVAVYAAFTYLAAETGWDFRKSATASDGTD